MNKKFPFLLMLLLAAGCGMAQSAEEQIRAARAASNEAIARHDADGIVRDMMPDYSIVTGRGQHVQGKDSILKFWMVTFKGMPEVVYVRTPVSIIISGNDSLAWETGRWAATHSYSAGGQYSAMWRKRGDSWKLAAELFVSLEK
jgi:uncharacterized protein (TIGR02246 family)